MTVPPADEAAPLGAALDVSSGLPPPPPPPQAANASVADSSTAVVPNMRLIIFPSKRQVIQTLANLHAPAYPRRDHHPSGDHEEDLHHEREQHDKNGTPDNARV